MGFNSAFKGLNLKIFVVFPKINIKRRSVMFVIHHGPKVGIQCLVYSVLYTFFWPTLYIKCQKLPCVTCYVFCTGGDFSEPVVGVLLCRMGH